LKRIRANIYLADPISEKDELYLHRNNFKIINLCNYSLDDVIHGISLNDRKSDVSSALVIRSYRRLLRPHIGLLASETNIKLICTLSSGYDHIDLEYCSAKGIKVINVPGGNSVSAAEHTFAMILSFFKNLFKYDNMLRKGNFKSDYFDNHELSGKTIGIIGVGRVGSKVARYARCFGMKVLANDIDRKVRDKYRSLKFVTLDYLLKNSDIITLHVPLNPTTEKLINRSNIRMIKKGSVIINCARGGVIDEEVLIRILKSGKIRGAALDVFETEPCVRDELKKLKNVIITPHVAGKTVQSYERISYLAVRRIIGYFSNRVSPLD